MNTVCYRLLTLGLTFILTACDNGSSAFTENALQAVVPVDSSIKKTQLLRLNVNESVLKSVQQSTQEPIALSDSVKLQIKPVKDQQRLSVNGKLLLHDRWQTDYLDNIDGGKLELQLRFDD